MKSVRALLLLFICTFVIGCGVKKGSLEFTIINVKLDVELLELTLKDDFGDIYVITVPPKEVRFRDNIEAGYVYVEFWVREGDNGNSISTLVLDNLFTPGAMRKRDIVLPYSEYEKVKK